MLGWPFRKANLGEAFLTAPGRARGPKAAETARREALCAQALPVVHTIASSLRVDRSLASAIRHAARHLDGVAAEELARLEWAVRIRHFQTVDEGFAAFADAVGRADPEFKRALLTLGGAEAETSREGLERRLDRAYDIVVRAEERRRERLVATLERPAQVLFGLGVVLPLVMASLFPMLQFTGGSFGAVPTALLLLVAVPAATLASASKILKRNFLGAVVADSAARGAFAAALTPPLAGGVAFAVFHAFGLSGLVPLPLAVAAVSGAAGAAAGFALARKAARRERATSELNKGLADLLHAAGTKMVGGRSAEHALLEAVESSKETALASRLRGVLFDVIVGRRSLADAIERDDEVREAPRAFPTLRLLASAATRDTEAAGHVVVHLGEFERLRAEASESLRAKCRSVVDTTRTTVTVFAPLILGITAGMYGLLSRVGTSFVPGAVSTPALGSDGFAAIVGLYLCLEVALAGWFAARLLSDTPVSAFGRGIARDIPVSMGLFAAALAGSATLF